MYELEGQNLQFSFSDKQDPNGRLLPSYCRISDIGTIGMDDHGCTVIPVLQRPVVFIPLIIGVLLSLSLTGFFLRKRNLKKQAKADMTTVFDRVNNDYIPSAPPCYTVYERRQA
jgi:hypothetical protein